jgi:uncharacterized protein YndB with AHSA1/START domain
VDKHASDGTPILGSLRSVDGRGAVRLEHRFDTDIDDVWSAITDPDRLARWHARIEGELRAGGTFRRYVEEADWDGTGRVEVCEPPRRLVVTTRESDESWRKGQGVPPFDQTLDAMLTADGEQTILAVEIGNLPLEPLAFYGVGWQLHCEALAAYLAGGELGDTRGRWDLLVPAYQLLAAEIAA